MVDILRTISALVGGIVGVSITVMAIWLSEYAPQDEVSRGHFVAVAVAAGVLWAAAVVTFAICEHLSRRNERDRLGQTIRDVVRGEKIFDSRNRAIADSARLLDQISLLLTSSDIETKNQLRTRIGPSPYGDLDDAGIKSVIDEESAKLLSEFNRGYWERARSLMENEAKGYNVGPYPLTALREGAKVVQDIHAIYNCIDAFNRQLIHGI